MDSETIPNVKVTLEEGERQIHLESRTKVFK